VTNSHPDSSHTKRARLHPEIKRLREDEGLSWREIGDRLGVSLKTAHDYYTDPTGEIARGRRRRYGATEKARETHRRWNASPAGRGRCQDCGGLMGAATRGTDALRCLTCSKVWRREMLELRLSLVHGMFEAGWTWAEMSAGLGLNAPYAVSTYIVELRQRGIIGHRRAVAA
jgi:transposase